jgi:DNA-binding FadR family transcriptional regulator
MERWGLVAQLEAELERTISRGLLPEDGQLPSERTLASQYGVCRATAREALLRLRARGLVEVHPGRRARAVVMEQAARLENLGTALLGEGPAHPERQHMLAGYLELKRQVLVELLAACCQRASEEELERVRGACFLLGDAVCWELKRPQWLAMEFELLRQAAMAARQPGHWLLIQTLERACRGMAWRVEPHLDSAALYQWTQCALETLCSKDVKALRCRLPELLQASDERVLQALEPRSEAHGVASLLGAQRQEPEVEASAHPTLAQVEVVSELAEASLTSTQALESAQPASEPVQAGGMGALCAKWSGHHTSWCEVPPGGAPSAPAPTVPGSTPSTGVLWPPPRRRTAGTGPLAGASPAVMPALRASATPFPSTPSESDGPDTSNARGESGTAQRASAGLEVGTGFLGGAKAGA